MHKDIRWLQRFENFKRAITFFKKSVDQQNYSLLEQAGLIQSFEFTFELAWKTLKDYLTEVGFTVLYPRDIIKQAFQSELIHDGHLWLQMLEHRNRLTHTYNEKQTEEAVRIIREIYFPLLWQLFKTLEEINVRTSGS